MDAQRFRAISPHHRALVAVAVLLDGHEAGIFLKNDAAHGAVLERAASEMAKLDLQLRMAYLGTILRTALRQLTQGDRKD